MKRILAMLMAAMLVLMGIGAVAEGETPRMGGDLGMPEESGVGR